jgi:hypothetical protein
MHKLLQQNILQSIPLSSRWGIPFVSRKTFLIPEQPAGVAKAASGPLQNLLFVPHRMARTVPYFPAAMAKTMTGK